MSWPACLAAAFGVLLCIAGVVVLGRRVAARIRGEALRSPHVVLPEAERMLREAGALDVQFRDGAVFANPTDPNADFVECGTLTEVFQKLKAWRDG